MNVHLTRLNPLESLKRLFYGNFAVKLLRNQLHDFSLITTTYTHSNFNYRKTKSQIQFYL